MRRLKEQTFDFYQQMSFKFAARRYLKTDSKNKPFELRELAHCYPHQFRQDSFYMRMLFELLNDKETSFFACEGFRHLGESMPVKALWDKDLVSALSLMNVLNRDCSFYCSAVIYGCRNAIANGTLTIEQFCRSPFAYKLVELAGRDDRQQVYRAVHDLIISDIDAFAREPWARDFDLQALTHRDASSLFEDDRFFFETFDFDDPNFRVDMSRLNGFFRSIDPTFQAIPLSL